MRYFLHISIHGMEYGIDKARTQILKHLALCSLLNRNNSMNSMKSDKYPIEVINSKC